MQVVQKLGLVNFHRHLVRISRTDLNDRLFHRNSYGRTDWSTEVVYPLAVMACSTGKVN